MAHILYSDLQMETARALVAEPDPAVRQLLVRALEQRGVHAIAVDDAAAVFAVVGNGRFDIVVLDTELPGADPDEMMECLAGIDPRPIAVGLTPSGNGFAEHFDGSVIPMTVPVHWDLEILADILTRSARDHHATAV